MNTLASTSSAAPALGASMRLNKGGSGSGAGSFGRPAFAARTSSSLSKTSLQRASPLSAMTTTSSSDSDDDEGGDSDDESSSNLALPQRATDGAVIGSGLPSPSHHKSPSNSSSSDEDSTPSIQASYFSSPTRVAGSSVSTSSAGANCVATSTSSGSASSMGKHLARKRADSLKWSKYDGMGSVTIELGLSNDELRRV